jgi:TnpA family transposase
VDAQTTYQHIDALFTQVVDWDLIARHWQDMMQVVLSIQAGHVAKLARISVTYMAW